MTKISQLSSIGDSLAVDDQFLIRDVSDGSAPNKSVTVSGITRALDVGTAAAPAIAFATDKNTGIYSPGADQVAISTGGSGRLFVDASGNVKLGSTAASGFRLAVDGDSWFGNAAGTEIGRLFNDSGVLCLRASSNVTGLGLATNSSSTHAIRITSAGLVGIGTSNWDLNSVNTKMGVRLSGTTGDGISLLSQQNVANQYVAVGAQYDNTNTNNGSQIRFGIDSAGDTFSMIAFATANGGAPSEKMRLDRLGRLGIGTTSPGALLDCKVTSSKFVRITEDQAASNTGVIRCTESDGTNRGMGVAGNFIAFLQGADNTSTITERARIDSSGRLLVGTSTAGSGGTLSVNGTTSVGGGSTGSQSSMSTVGMEQTSSVSTTAKTIFTSIIQSLSSAAVGHVIVYGHNNVSAGFLDVLVVVPSGTVTVLSSTSVAGSPAARTYTMSTNALQLSMASGTYSTNVRCTSMGYPF